jgi:hypothetical protein
MLFFSPQRNRGTEATEKFSFKESQRTEKWSFLGDRLKYLGTFEIAEYPFTAESERRQRAAEVSFFWKIDWRIWELLRSLNAESAG